MKEVKPWKLIKSDSENPYWWLITDHDGMHIANFSELRKDARPLQAKYAQIMVTAPELLEIAKEMRHRLADQIGVPLEKCVGGFFKRWDEIIAKAEATNA